jgi:hypothetical protein
MPVTFGTLRPAIVLPASCDTWAADRRQAVLLHELAHVARGDCLVQRITAVACACYWPHPGVWWAARRLRVERELACDDRVLAMGAGAREYASHLLEIAHSFRAAPAPATALGMARPRQLEQRLLAILDAARNRSALHRRGIVFAIVLSLGGFLPVTVIRAALVPADALLEQQAAASPASTSAADLAGTWEVRPGREAGMVQVTVRTPRGSRGRTLRVADLEKALPADARSAIVNGGQSGTVHFPLVREAGTFMVDGVGRQGVWGGTWTFEPSAAFASDLQKRGIGRPSAPQQLELAVADVGKDYFDALASAGYAKPDIETLVRAAQHGVSLAYLHEMTALGYRFDTLDRLTTLRDHGVDPQYVRGMAAEGYKSLSSEALLRARDHGVDPEYVRGMAALGYRGSAIDDLVRTRDHGVDPEYVRGMADLGYASVAIADLIRMRDHGVDPRYTRDMAALGYKGASMDDLVRMRDHGVDAEYVRRVQRSGAGQLSVDQIIARRDRGGE